jgi:hypothetical protein
MHNIHARQNVTKKAGTQSIMVASILSKKDKMSRNKSMQSFPRLLFFPDGSDFLVASCVATARIEKLKAKPFFGTANGRVTSDFSRHSVLL